MTSRLCALLPLLFLALPPSAPPRYHATRLGSLPRHYTTEANAINDAGVAVGFSEQVSRVAVRWDNGRPRELGKLAEWDSSVAVAINRAGMAVGYAEQNNKVRACRFAEGKATELGTLGGDSRATGITDTGDIVGWSAGADSVPHAVLWHGGKLRDLGTLGGARSWATGVNARGEVAGYLNPSVPNPGGSRPFLWRDGRLTLLEILPGYDFSETHAVNARGDVAGASLLKGAAEVRAAHAFLYRAGKLQDLGTLGGSYSRAHALNDGGKVVGAATLKDGHPHAFLWDGARMLDLNRCLRSNSGWELLEARGINNRGQVVGIGTYQGQQRGFLLTPGPDPAFSL